MYLRRCLSVQVLGLSGLGLLLLSAPAMAHHPFGEETPTTALAGFLSGLGHPVIGLDHLAVVITVGLLAVVCPRGHWIPGAFLITALLGTLIHLQGLDLPASEVLISASVLGLASILAMKNTLPVGGVIALAAGAGVCHGYAYGEAIVGADMSALLAYLLGFTAIQMAIAGGVYGIANLGNHTSHMPSLQLRFAGFTLAGVGAALLSTVVLG